MLCYGSGLRISERRFRSSRTYRFRVECRPRRRARASPTATPFSAPTCCIRSAATGKSSALPIISSPESSPALTSVRAPFSRSAAKPAAWLEPACHAPPPASQLRHASVENGTDTRAIQVLLGQALTPPRATPLSLRPALHHCQSAGRDARSAFTKNASADAEKDGSQSNRLCRLLAGRFSNWPAFSGSTVSDIAPRADSPFNNCVSCAPSTSAAPPRWGGNMSKCGYAVKDYGNKAVTPAETATRPSARAPTA